MYNSKTLRKRASGVTEMIPKILSKLCFLNDCFLAGFSFGVANG